MPQFSGAVLSQLSKITKVYIFDTIESTQVIAKKLAKNNISSHTNEIQFVVVANQQTKGQGRFGRPWYSPLEGLYFSILLNCPQQEDSMSLWTLLVTKIIADVLEQVSSLPIYIKWPNDLVLLNDNNPTAESFNNITFRKVGGILCETTGSSILRNQIDKKNLIIGIGLNINQTSFPEDLPEATSLKKEIKLQRNNKNLNQEEILYKIIARLSNDLAQFSNMDFKQNLINQVRQKSSVLGKRIKVLCRRQTFCGMAIDFDEQGRLVLRTDAGRIIVLNVGEVFSIR